MSRPRLALVLLLALSPSCGPNDDPGSGAEQGPTTDSAAPPFEEVSQRTGLTFHHFLGSSGEYFLPEILSAGAALLDYDSDGDLDVYLIQGVMLDPAKNPQESPFPRPEAEPLGNRLFRNELIPSGQLTFTDASESSGLAVETYGMGAAVGDFDNDSDPDLFLTALGRNALYRNQGDGTFVEITPKGMDDERWSTSATFFDYDSDGDLDLFFINYVDFNIRNNKDCFDPTGARDYCTPNAYRSVPDRLFRNDGAAGWRDVSVEAGFGTAYGNGLGVAAADFNGDGRPDLYVANDGVANQLWINQGNGRFEDTSLLAGAAYNSDGRAEAGMGVTAADFDFDGDQDLFMTHLAQETNTLYLNNGRGEFRDATNRFGLGSVSMPFTGFGVQWLDYDRDGFLDLIVANGAVTIVESQRGDPYPFRQRNQLFRGGPERFEDLSPRAGPAFEEEAVSRALAAGDLDGDGDVDIVLANNNGPARLLLNRAADGARWIGARLTGSESNRDAIGARVALLTSDSPPRWQRVHRDGSYLSSSDAAVSWGLGPDAAVEGLGVVWPSGRQEIYRGLTEGESNPLREGEGEPWTPPTG